MIYNKIGGGGGLTAGSYSAPNPSAAKFASQGDAHVRTDAQIKFLYYPLPPCTKGLKLVFQTTSQNS